eukprot:TRINITY_DN13472_c0_g1_i1.p3 TRINITY_DN13472_c0_g1~~TRINITY_DN13472_c0_g1_i1.p3  ORF type:complete len:168 (-),score=7.22 TRINITY_DN13472_c0_g1_i1:92-595(-)
MMYIGLNSLKNFQFLYLKKQFQIQIQKKKKQLLDQQVSGKMKISILTLFPEMFSIFNHSIIGRAKENKIVHLELINIRDFTLDKHKKVDDYPYGGGPGMVMSAQPIVSSITHVKKTNRGKVIFLGPRGKTFNQDMAKELSKEEELIFLCGHYEGIDERVYKLSLIHI